MSIVAVLRLQPAAFGFSPAVEVAEVIVAEGLLSGNTYRGLGAQVVLDCVSVLSPSAGIILLIKIRTGLLV